MRQFNLIRYFSLLTFVLVVAVGGVLGEILRRHEVHELQLMAEDRNVAMTRIFHNVLWSEFSPLIKAGRRLSTPTLRELAELSGLRDRVVALMHDSDTIKVKVYDTNGLTIFSTEASQIGEDKRGNAGYQAAVLGGMASELTHRNQFDAFEGVIENLDVISSYVPLTEDGKIVGVIETYQDVTRFKQRIDQLRMVVWAVVIAVLGALYLIQLLVVRRAHIILGRQEDALRAANQDLDRRVLERTSELAAANEQLNTEVEQRRKTQEQLDYLSYFDALTGLANRTLLQERLLQASAAAEHRHHFGALLFIDLDHFRTLNDVDGRGWGDSVLREVAKRLRQSVVESDTIARVGADQFALLIDALGETEGRAADLAEDVAERVRSLVSALTSPSAESRHLSCSIGVTLYGGQAHPADELLKQAELAMYEAKAAGRNTHRFFDPAMQATVAARATLEADLRTALLAQEFFLHYQPQVLQDGKIAGAEALLRWRHPTRGWVSPAEFIPFSEETGLILPIGRWVLETACRQLAQWSMNPLLVHLTVAVNVSAKQFHQADFVDDVLAIIDATGAPAGRLKLELTESILLTDAEEAVAKMVRLKSRGLHFSLDDFGTGFSSLSYLTRLPLDQLKIDQSFVAGIEHRDTDALLCASIISLAKHLHLTIVAEGVETNAQRFFLGKVHHCDLMQGFLFSKALPVAEFEASILSPAA